MKNFEYFLMFTAGTGGHFIASQMCKNLYDPQLEIKRNDVNEWDAKAVRQYCLRGFLHENISESPDVKILLNHGWTAEQINNSGCTFDRKIFVVGNGYTRLLTKIKKMYKEYNDDTITNMLDSIIVMLYKNFNSVGNHLMLPNLDIRGNFHNIKLQTYKALQPVEDLLKPDREDYIQTVYEYVAFATLNNFTPSLDGFKKFLGEVLVLTSTPKPQMDKFDFYQEMLGEHANSTEFVSYNDVYYNKTKTIPGVHADEIDKYNLSNYELVQSILTLVDDESAAQLVNNIHAAGIPFKR